MLVAIATDSAINYFQFRFRACIILKPICDCEIKISPYQIIHKIVISYLAMRTPTITVDIIVINN